jgi:hypothetical protein
MFEKRIQPLAPRRTFFMRLLHSIGLGLVAITLAQFIGMLGYHHFEKMSWVDAFVNSAMILSGMGPMGSLTTTAGKIFAGFYALFSGLMFILIIGLIFAPIFHRFFHKFHLDTGTDSKSHPKKSPSSSKHK